MIPKFEELFPPFSPRRDLSGSLASDGKKIWKSRENKFLPWNEHRADLPCRCKEKGTTRTTVKPPACHKRVSNAAVAKILTGET